LPLSSTPADRDTLPPNQDYESQYLDLGAELTRKRQLSFFVDVLYFCHTIGWAGGNGAAAARWARRQAVDDAWPTARRRAVRGHAVLPSQKSIVLSVEGRT
jgi:hypothetical protein